jgi:4'-phosphopantetheinyl transferase EntD
MIPHVDAIARSSRLAARPGLLPAFASYAIRWVGDPANSATEAELALLHPQSVVARRAAFAAGRTAAHAALAELDRDVPAILAGPMRQPLWPDGVAASLSHAGDVAVAVAAPLEQTGGVGIDIEMATPAPELWDQVPLPGERRWLQAIGDAAERDRMLVALFSAKEAIYKAFFPRVGTYFGFDAAALEPTPYGFAASFVANIDEAYPQGRAIRIHSAWIGDLVRSWLVLPR